MAKFLTTVGNSFYIEQIIINAKKSLTLITPYLSLSKNLMNRLSDANRKGVKMTLVYGKNELREVEKRKIESLENLEIFYCENLHAKCYHNESSLIITSMNLYEFSERNNREMGLLVEKVVDEQIFQDTLEEIDSIKNSSVKEKSVKLDDENTEQELNNFTLHPDFKEKFNFHLPSLYQVLKKKYAHFSIDFKKVILIEKFPREGIDLIVDGRIDFKFIDEQDYKSIKKQYQSSFRELLPNIRLFWNYNQINIYQSKGFSVEVNQSGLEQKVERMLEVIDTVYRELKDEN